MAPDIPTVCKAAKVKNRGPDYELETVTDYPVPKPSRGELLLKFNATGLCLSDYHYMKGDWGFGMAPHVNCAGHEGAGVVVAIGDEVDSEQWKVGDRAGVGPLFDTCGSCEQCRSGYETYCDKGIPTCAFVNGSFQQYLCTPARYTHRIPEGLADELAGPILCSGATCYAALKASGARAGNWVVIPGAGGGVGHMAVQFASKVLGLRVVAVDTGDEKKKMCLELGAEAFIDFMTTKDVFAEVRKVTGGGAHAVIVTGGTGSAYKDAQNHLRKGGVVVGVGMPAAGTALLGCEPMIIIAQRLTLKGQLVASLQDTSEALGFAARGLVKPHVTTYPFEEFPSAFKLLAESKVTGRAVVVYDQ